ncbi:hypothetical protein QFW96_08420 [Saccharopolyspora sp. TS4A08]|uniref:Uncharacterized protein n=1 Tax=Saccharopolyspora ipomoeae TaxID=3042027 RepID=A0ABT6PMD3_9PSEU|nr:hypothetical protein [Saccharopolyspora sp. TS4A08]MDI2028631.1 hypothetical protein [Saccharopolyspora sp. TS4A08]
MTKQSTALAVRLRQAQWLLDELAFDAGSDRLDAHQIAEAVVTLSQLNALLSGVHATIVSGVGGEVFMKTSTITETACESRKRSEVADDH